MVKDSKILQVLLVVVIGIGLQFIFILLGTEPVHDSPNHGAAEFARAYFQNDPQVLNRICTSQMESSISGVNASMLLVEKEARLRGFDASFMSSMLYQLKTETEFISDSEAKVRITAKRKTAINPVFFLVAVIFDLGETHRVDTTLKMIKEHEAWKVCDPFPTVFEHV